MSHVGTTWSLDEAQGLQVFAAILDQASRASDDDTAVVHRVVERCTSHDEPVDDRDRDADITADGRPQRGVRGAIRAEYDRDAIFEVLDAGLIAHVGVVTDSGPIVLPMAYGRTDDWLYVHGSAANAALRTAVGRDVCVTVTIVDGLVVGRHRSTTR